MHHPTTQAEYDALMTELYDEYVGSTPPADADFEDAAGDIVAHFDASEGGWVWGEMDPATVLAFHDEPAGDRGPLPPGDDLTELLIADATYAVEDDLRAIHARRTDGECQ